MDKKKEEKIELIKKSFQFKNLKQYKEAIEMLYKALEYDEVQEDNVELLSQIGDLHILLNNRERALDEFQKALSINKNHKYSQQRCYDIYVADNNYTKALKIAKKMCDENKDAVSYKNYITALIKTEKYQEAIEVFNSLDESFKLNPDILYLISVISPEKKKFILKKVLEIDNLHKNANLDLAKIELESGNFQKAIQCCINVGDDDPRALYYLGLIEVKKHNFNSAIKLFSDAIKFDNDNHDIYYDLARAYMEMSWYKEALEALKKSINFSLLRKDTASLNEKYFVSGWILIKQNEYSKALLNLNLIDKSSDVYSSAQILIQTINLMKLNIAEAKAKLEKYYNQEKDNPLLLDALAYIYKELKLYSKAIQVLKRSLRLYPDSISNMLELIDLLIDDKRYEEAIEYIDRVKFINENCVSIYNSLARIYYRLKDLPEALSAIEKYIELDPNKAEAHYFRGLILNDLQNYEEAKKSIYTSIKLNPAVAKYYSQMARSYKELGDTESAFLYIKEAIELDKANIKYKKQAYEITLQGGNKEKIKAYENILKQSERIARLRK